MKLTPETYEIIIDALETEYNSCDDEKRRKQISEALSEVDTLGVY